MWFSKTEFSKEKSGYQSCHLADSLVKSPLNPVCLSHYIAGHSAPASERGPRDEATAFQALWGSSFPALGPQLPIISFQHPSPQHSLPPRPSPGKRSFPGLCWVSAGNLLSLAGSRSSLAWTSHPVGLQPPQVPPCFGDASRSLISRGGSERNPGTHSHPGPSWTSIETDWSNVGICQAVIQARGDLDRDEASIVKTTLWSGLWGWPWAPRYSEGKKPRFLQKSLRVNGSTQSIRRERTFFLDLCLKHKSEGRISQLSPVLCEHIHAFKLLISLLTDVIVKYVLFAFEMRDWTDGERSV